MGKPNIQELRIIAVMGMYGSLIMANTTKSEYLILLWSAISLYWLIRFIVLSFKK